jgi:hypothetical protein
MPEEGTIGAGAIGAGMLLASSKESEIIAPACTTPSPNRFTLAFACSTREFKESVVRMTPSRT